MFLKEKLSDNLIQVANLEELFSPLAGEVSGRSQAGQEEQDVELYAKSSLVFPSGESLPRCWVDSEYHGDADA